MVQGTPAPEGQPAGAQQALESLRDTRDSFTVKDGELTALAAMFRTMDKTRSGMLTKDNTLAALQSIGVKVESRAVVEAMAVSLGPGGQVRYQAFLDKIREYSLARSDATRSARSPQRTPAVAGPMSVTDLSAQHSTSKQQVVSSADVAAVERASALERLRQLEFEKMQSQRSPTSKHAVETALTHAEKDPSLVFAQQLLQTHAGDEVQDLVVRAQTGLAIVINERESLKAQNNELQTLAATYRSDNVHLTTALHKETQAKDNFMQEARAAAEMVAQEREMQRSMTGHAAEVEGQLREAVQEKERLELTKQSYEEQIRAANREIADLNAVVVELKSENSELRTDLEEMEGRMENRIESLKERLSLAESARDQYHDERDRLQAELDDSQGKGVTMQAQIKTLNDRVAQLLSNNERDHNASVAISKKAEDVKAQLDESLENLNAKTRQVQELQYSLQVSQDREKWARENMEEYKAKVTSVQDELLTQERSFTAQLTEIREKCNQESNASLGDLTKARAEARGALERLAALEHQWEEEKAQLKTDVHGLQSELKGRLAEIDALDMQLRQANETISIVHRFHEAYLAKRSAKLDKIRSSVSDVWVNLVNQRWMMRKPLSKAPEEALAVRSGEADPKENQKNQSAAIDWLKEQEAVLTRLHVKLTVDRDRATESATMDDRSKALVELADCLDSVKGIFGACIKEVEKLSWNTGSAAGRAQAAASEFEMLKNTLEGAGHSATTRLHPTLHSFVDGVVSTLMEDWKTFFVSAEALDDEVNYLMAGHQRVMALLCLSQASIVSEGYDSLVEDRARAESDARVEQYVVDMNAEKKQLQDMINVTDQQYREEIALLTQQKEDLASDCRVLQSKVEDAEGRAKTLTDRNREFEETLTALHQRTLQVEEARNTAEAALQFEKQRGASLADFKEEFLQENKELIVRLSTSADIAPLSPGSPGSHGPNTEILSGMRQARRRLEQLESMCLRLQQHSTALEGQISTLNIKSEESELAMEKGKLTVIYRTCSAARRSIVARYWNSWTLFVERCRGLQHDVESRTMSKVCEQLRLENRMLLGGLEKRKVSQLSVLRRTALWRRRVMMVQGLARWSRMVARARGRLNPFQAPPQVWYEPARSTLTNEESRMYDAIQQLRQENDSLRSHLLTETRLRQPGRSAASLPGDTVNVRHLKSQLEEKDKTIQRLELKLSILLNSSYSSPKRVVRGDGGASPSSKKDPLLEKMMSQVADSALKKHVEEMQRSIEQLRDMPVAGVVDSHVAVLEEKLRAAESELKRQQQQHAGKATQLFSIFENEVSGRVDECMRSVDRLVKHAMSLQRLAGDHRGELTPGDVQFLVGEVAAMKAHATRIQDARAALDEELLRFKLNLGPREAAASRSDSPPGPTPGPAPTGESVFRTISKERDTFYGSSKDLMEQLAKATAERSMYARMVEEMREASSGNTTLKALAAVEEDNSRLSRYIVDLQSRLMWLRDVVLRARDDARAANSPIYELLVQTDLDQFDSNAELLRGADIAREDVDIVIIRSLENQLLRTTAEKVRLEEIALGKTVAPPAHAPGVTRGPGMLDSSIADNIASSPRLRRRRSSGLMETTREVVADPDSVAERFRNYIEGGLARSIRRIRMNHMSAVFQRFKAHRRSSLIFRQLKVRARQLRARQVLSQLRRAVEFWRRRAIHAQKMMLFRRFEQDREVLASEQAHLASGIGRRLAILELLSDSIAGGRPMRLLALSRLFGRWRVAVLYRSARRYQGHASHFHYASTLASSAKSAFIRWRLGSAHREHRQRLRMQARTRALDEQRAAARAQMLHGKKAKVAGAMAGVRSTLMALKEDLRANLFQADDAHFSNQGEVQSVLSRSSIIMNSNADTSVRVRAERQALQDRVAELEEELAVSRQTEGKLRAIVGDMSGKFRSDKDMIAKYRAVLDEVTAPTPGRKKSPRRSPFSFRSRQSPSPERSMPDVSMMRSGVVEPDQDVVVKARRQVDAYRKERSELLARVQGLEVENQHLKDKVAQGSGTMQEWTSFLHRRDQELAKVRADVQSYREGFVVDLSKYKRLVSTQTDELGRMEEKLSLLVAENKDLRLQVNAAQASPKKADRLRRERTNEELRMLLKAGDVVDAKTHHGVQRENSELQREIRDLRARVKALERTNDSLEALLTHDGALSSSADLGMSIRERDRRTDAERDLAGAMEHNSALQEDISNLRHALAEKETQIADLTRSLNMAGPSSPAHSGQLEAHAKEIEFLNKQIVDMHREQRAADNVYNAATLLKDRDKLNESLQQARSEISRLTQRTAELEGDLADSRKRLDDKAEQVDVLMARGDKAERYRQERDEAVEELRKVTDGERDKRKRSVLKEEIDSLTEENDALYKENKDLKRQSKALEREKTDLADEVDVLTGKLDRAIHQASVTEGLLMELRKELDSKNAQLRVREGELLSGAEEADASVQRLSTRLNQERQRSEELEKELEAVQKRVESDKEDIKTELMAVKRELAEAYMKMEKLEGYKEESVELAMKVSDLQDELLSAKRGDREATPAQEQMQEEIRSLRVQVGTELADLKAQLHESERSRREATAKSKQYEGELLAYIARLEQAQATPSETD